MDRKPREFDRFPFENKQKSLEKISFLRHTVDKFHGRTYTHDEELALLFELARGSGFDVPDTGYCLDFGTWFGLSALSMAFGVRESRLPLHPVLTVDAYSPRRHYLENDNFKYKRSDTFNIDVYLDQTGGRPICLRGAAYYLGLEDYICQFVFDSVNLLRQPFMDIPIRLAFLDSSHDISTVDSELKLVLKKLLPGGWIVFHDYCDRNAYSISVCMAANNFIDSRLEQDINVFQYRTTLAIRVKG